MKHPKRLFILLTALALLACLVCCSPKETPGLTDAEAEAVLQELLPRSANLMQIFYGVGLTPESTEIKDAYDGVQYEKVIPGQGYESIAQLKAAMEGLYSTGYKQELYILMFEGYEPPKETQKDEEVLDDIILPRYREEEGSLMVDIKYDAYDIQTVPSHIGAKVISGNATRVSVEIPYTTKSGESGTMRVSLALDGGAWLLDGPTY